MPAIQWNSLTRLLPNTGLIAGVVTGAAATPAFTGSGTANDQARVTVTDNGTGDYTLTIDNFKGPNGVAFGFGNALTVGNFVNPVAITYSGNTATAQFKVTSDAGAAADDTLNVLILAF